ncbi:MAG TPA: anti-sigma factor antagonist [Firmicutes bacterium]|jgi:anti-anti-sigma factor|nr:anti-sigma factor antagonist [Bacillota bacterium]
MEKLIKEIKEAGKDNKVTVMALQGYLDSGTSNILVQRFTRLLAEDKLYFVLDMAEVEFVAAVGWNTIIGVLNNIKSGGGDIHITALRRDPEKAFHLLEYDRVLSYYKESADAILSFYDSRIPVTEIENINLDTVEDFTGVRYLTLKEKISRILETYPDISIFKMKQLLKTPAYDYTKVSLLSLIMTKGKITGRKGR